MTQQQDDRPGKRMVRSTIRMLIPLHLQSEALEILKSVSVRTRFEPSCISSRLYHGADELRAIMIEELWMDEKALMSHLQSSKYRQVLLVVEMAEEPPDIRFETIKHLGGIETIEDARASN